MNQTGAAGGAGVIGALLFLVIFLALYFLPTIIASQRHRVSVGAIAAVNIFFGWTVLGWVICLAWALSGNSNTAETSTPAGRACPNCAETIKWEAVVCRFCNRDVPALPAPNPWQ